MARRPLSGSPRILGTHVPALFPANPEAPVHLLVYGEAPGPRGADKSGKPFWGDACGVFTWKALERAGLALVPEDAWVLWRGDLLLSWGLEPILLGAALSNAYPACPTDDQVRFRSPRKDELLAPNNLQRIEGEVQEALRRCPGQLGLATLGGAAKRVFEALKVVERPRIQLHMLPHPSAQGLLSSAPDNGRGANLANLQEAWVERLASLVHP